MIWYRFKEDIHSAPTGGGIYYLADLARQTLYLGRAANIRDAIMQSPERIAGQAVVYFSWEINSANSEQELKELIKEQHPPGNKPFSFW